MFLVASDDMKWCEEYLSQPGVHMVELKFTFDHFIDLNRGRRLYQNKDDLFI